MNRDTAYQIAVQILTDNPVKEGGVDFFFCENDITALGALQAVLDEERDDVRFIVTMGGNSEMLESIQSKESLTPMTVSYLPADIAEATLRSIQAYAETGESDGEVVCASHLITIENVADYLEKAYND